MAYADELIEKFKQDSPEEPPQNQQEQPQEQPEDPKGAEDTAQPETPPEGPETQNTDTPPEEKPEDRPEEKPEEKPETKPEEKPAETKPDLSTLTKEQKAEHAFKRQLAKQQSKYESIISDMNGKFDKVAAELEEIKKAKAEAEKKPLTRDQFEYDDDFVKALVKQGMDEELAKRAAQEAQQKAEQDKKDREQAEIQEAQRRAAEHFNENCRAAFKDEEYTAFEAKLKKGVANGLAEFLDQAPAVRDYIFEQAEGPLVLNEMLTNKDSFVRVMSQGANPMAAYITMHDLAREIAARAPQETPEEAPKPKSTMPSIGKPGAKQTATAGDMWTDDEALLDFVRKHK